MKKLGILLAGCMALSSSAFAFEPTASLSDLSGKVLVNKGEGFVTAGVDTLLVPGDRILVGEESFAVLSYSGCAVALDKPAVIVVKGEGACDGAGAGVMVQPTADAVPVPFFTPAVALTTVGILGTACLVGCKSIFGNNKSPATP